VLCALPALAENGLFAHLETLPVLSGYYMTLHLILLLAYMALCRIKAVEQLQYETPGELGKLMGLDRIPEVRCLRKKMSQLSQNEAPQQWAAVLSKVWMQQSPELAGMLYVDGHVRLYHGQQTQLPRRYVARQRLCMRGATDYWINDMLCQPFFSIDRPVWTMGCWRSYTAMWSRVCSRRSPVSPRLNNSVPTPT
jgi:prepilin-type processing-associated H-X9-DG protein